MARITRRQFLVSSTATVVACAGPTDVKTGGPRRAAVRAPEVDQSWRYVKHDLVSGVLLDTEVNRVAVTGAAIGIVSHSESKPEGTVAYPSWGNPWTAKYMNPDLLGNSHVGEVQIPWGMVLVDSHWPRVQAYEKPIPLWPVELRSGWSGLYSTNYRTPETAESLPWELKMTAHNWDTVSVPAGRFTALRYTNLIDLRYSNVSGRVAGQRKETIWFAPEIGRWVIRESTGMFYQDVGEEFREPATRWELLSYT